MVQCGVQRSVLELVTAINVYVQANNKKPKPFSRVKTADQILAFIKALLPDHT